MRGNDMPRTTDYEAIEVKMECGKFVVKCESCRIRAEFEATNDGAEKMRIFIETVVIPMVP
jgi:hypothetical protein